MGVQALRGVGIAATLVMLVAGAAAMLGAGLVVKWGIVQEELGALLGVMVILAVGVPLGMVGLVLLGGGLRGIGVLRRGARRAPGGERARADVIGSLGRVVLLLGVIGVVVWAVLADRLAWATTLIGGMVGLLVVVDVLSGRARGGAGADAE